MKIKKGDILTIRPEWQDKGDKGVEFLALEDEDGGRLPITPLGTGLMFPGNSVVTVDMVKATGKNVVGIQFTVCADVTRGKGK